MRRLPGARRAIRLAPSRVEEVPHRRRTDEFFVELTQLVLDHQPGASHGVGATEYFNDVFLAVGVDVRARLALHGLDGLTPRADDEAVVAVGVDEPRVSSVDDDRPGLLPRPLLVG